MGYGAGKGRRVNYGGHSARGGRHTLREIWHSSNTTMEFADWVLSLEDQVDLNNSIANSSIAGSHYTTEPMVNITTQPLISGTLMGTGLPIKLLHQLQQHLTF